MTQLGVDETSKAKGHDYVSLFVDLKERRTIFVAEGKGSETMGAFTKDFKEHHGNHFGITDVSIETKKIVVICKERPDNLGKKTEGGTMIPSTIKAIFFLFILFWVATAGAGTIYCRDEVLPNGKIHHIFSNTNNIIDNKW